MEVNRIPFQNYAPDRDGQFHASAALPPTSNTNARESGCTRDWLEVEAKKLSMFLTRIELVYGLEPVTEAVRVINMPQRNSDHYKSQSTLALNPDHAMRS